MVENIICMYVTLMPSIIAGILNMVWCKLPILNEINKPIDMGMNYKDGKRIFGDNKTFKGIVGYIILNALMMIVWGFVCRFSELENLNFLYVNQKNTILFNLIVGIFLGLGYALFELPNSFMKRRLDIEPGKTISGLKKVFFIFLDQADSVIGCTLVVGMFYKMSLTFYLMYVLLGSATHLIINMLLYFMKLRKNMF